MFKKKKTYVILLIIILAVGTFYYYKGKDPKIEYTTAAAYRGNLAQTVSVTGKMIAPREVELAFRGSGRIEKLFVNVGDTVTQGQKIATIDRGILNAQLKQAQQEVKIQKDTLDNIKRKHKIYSQDEEDVQENRLRKAQAGVEEVFRSLSETTVYSPIDGIIIRKPMEVGEILLAGSSVVTIAEKGDFKIESNVPESDIIKVALGQSVDVTLDAFTSQDIFTARISEIEPAATVIQDVVYYKVKMEFSDADGRFKNGMSADGDIHTAEKNGVVIIPLRGVKTDGDGKYVEILNGDGITIERMSITTGLEGDEGMVEVTSGLSGGENVITFTKEV